MRGNVWLSGDEGPEWIAELITASTCDEMEEIVDATTWRLSQPRLMADGIDPEGFINPFRSALNLKREIERRNADSSERVKLQVIWT